jgi:hypothetical protein
MTNISDAPGQGEPDPVVSPQDVPGSRPTALDRLAALLGQWDIEATFEAGYFGAGSPRTTESGGHTTFEWLPGRFFLTQRFSTEHPEAPSGLAIIGMGDTAETFTQHYYDSRGVSRVYQMSLTGGVWKLWRAEPGFWQRFAGEISGDGSTITGAWELSKSGRDWQHDFDLTYVKVG